jgi:hypothetical protein
MLKSKYLVLLALVLALTVGGGCIFSPDDDETCTDCNTDTGLPFPDSPDKLMTNFQTIYEQMDYSEYVKMVHPDYKMILQESTYNSFPGVGQTLDVTEELIIHEGMFSKQELTNSQGDLVPGVQTIQFQTFIRQGSWSLSPGNDDIPNAEYALYDVVFLFDRGQNYSTLKVQGAIKFYVTHRDSVVSGVTKPYYQMYGQIDLTQDTAP